MPAEQSCPYSCMLHKCSCNSICISLVLPQDALSVKYKWLTSFHSTSHQLTAPTSKMHPQSILSSSSHLNTIAKQFSHIVQHPSNQAWVSGYWPHVQNCNGKWTVLLCIPKNFWICSSCLVGPVLVDCLVTILAVEDSCHKEEWDECHQQNRCLAQWNTCAQIEIQ